MFIESSAKAGFNIKSLFRKLATALPGNDTVKPASSNLVDIKLSNNKPQTRDTNAAGACAC